MSTVLRAERIDLPRFTRALRPLVDAVAGVRASVHTKLLTGFRVGAGLLLLMALLTWRSSAGWTRESAT